MIRKIVILLMIVALSGLNVFPALAAISATKSYKMFVTLPAAVDIPVQDPIDEAAIKSKKRPRQTTEETVIVRNQKKFLLRTTVVR